MLETIYEVDENIIPDNDNENDDNDDSLKIPPNQSFRLSYYICWCMLTGCFLTLALIVAISLNPSLLSNKPINRNLINIPVNSDDKLTLSTNIIEHLDIFSHQIHEQLNLQPNTIIFFTSTVSNLSLKNQNQNQNEILWIYSHLKYPQSCIDNNECKENVHSKLKQSFTKLSDFLTTIELNSHHSRQIQLNWCDLIQNSTTAILVSLVSIRTINQTGTESIMTDDSVICKNIDPNILLPQTIDNILQHNFNNDNIEKEETGLTSNNPIDCSKHHDNNQRIETTTHCPNDIDIQIRLQLNSF